MSEQDIFINALELAPDERGEYLERACGEDQTVRRQVEALLFAHERSGEFLDQPAVEQIGDRALPSEQNTRTFTGDSSHANDRTANNQSAGEGSLSFLKPATRTGSIGRLDHYEILEQIGVGGFGTVFRAFDDRLQRVVAVKVLAPAYAANGSARRRFIREARTAAAVKNEHVVGIYDVEEAAQPPYLAMEMIDGCSLQEKLDKTGPLGVREILRIALQTAEGLAAAHRQGLVHRDIKPANILLENGVERVKITDFGLARAVDDASVTQSGTVAGTPMYMSPEQAEGLPVDHRSDLFSLGSVLYAMCTGHSPFRASGTHAVLKRVIEAAPRPIPEINDEIPAWLCDIISKLHAKKTAERFQSAKEVAELLQQRLAHLQQPNFVPIPAPVKVSSGSVHKVPDGVVPRQTFVFWFGVIVFCALFILVPAITLGEKTGKGLATLMAIGAIIVSAGVIKGVRKRLELNRQSAGATGQLGNADVSGPVASTKFWSSTVLCAFLGCLFGSVCWLIDSESLSLLGNGSSLLWNAAYATVMGAAVGVLVGFLRILSAARIAHEVNKAGGRLPEPTAPSRPGFWMFVPLLGFLGYVLFLAGGYIFSDRARLYMLDMGEVRIDDFPPEFEKFILTSDTSPEFVNGAPLPAHLPLFVGPGTYRIRAIGKHGEKVKQWEIKNSREALGPSTYQDGEECVLEIKRGQRVNVSISRAPGDADSPGAWVQLFNGKNLDGWQKAPADPGTWLVKDGALVGSSGPGQLFTSRDDFRNFHLRAEVSISKGADADIYFRSKRPPPGPAGKSRGPSGYVADLAEGRDRYVGPISFRSLKDGSWTTYGANSSVQPDEWFTFELIADGNHMVTKVNGNLVLGFEEELHSYKQGHIALRVWKPDTVIKFRKIEIRELKATPVTLEEMNREELSKLDGKWAVTLGKKNGQPLPGESITGMELQLKDGSFLLRIKGKGPERREGTYRIDAAKKQLLLRFDGTSLPLRCTYKVDGDQLKLNFPGRLDPDSASTEPFLPRVRTTRLNLKLLGLAMHNYATTYQQILPPAAITSAKDGKPLLSWRVTLLPFIEQDDLYRRFKLDEPWDSEHNKKLIEKMPAIFSTPGIASTAPGMTHYQVFVGPGTAFEPQLDRRVGVPFTGFTDGTANTLMLAEASSEVIWTKPEDLAFDPKKQPPSLGAGGRGSGANVCMVDGSVKTLSPDATNETIKGLITRNGNETIPDVFLQPEPEPRSSPLYLVLRRNTPPPAAVAPFDAKKAQPHQPN